MGPVSMCRTPQSGRDMLLRPLLTNFDRIRVAICNPVLFQMEKAFILMTQQERVVYRLTFV